MKVQKRIIYFILTFMVIVSAINAAYMKPKQVEASAIVITEGIAIAAILAACGLVYTGVTWWQDGSAAEVWDDNYEDEIGEIDDKCRDVWQLCLDKAGPVVVENANGFDPEEDDPNDKIPTWEKLKQWIKANPTEKLIAAGTTVLGAFLLQFANDLKDDVDENSADILPESFQRYTNQITDRFPDVEFYRGINYFGFESSEFKNQCFNWRPSDYLNAIVYRQNGWFVIEKSMYDTIKIYLGTNGFTIENGNSGAFSEYSFQESGSNTSTSSGRIYYVVGNLNNTTKLCIPHNINIELYNDNFELIELENELLSNYIPLTNNNVQFGSIELDENDDIVALPLPEIYPGSLAQNWPQLLPALQNALALGVEPAEEVDSIINSIGVAPSAPPILSPDNEVAPELEPLPDVESTDGLNKGSFLLPESITEKFPFCVPFDIVRAFGLFESTSRKAPYIRYPIKAVNYGIDYELIIDFSMFDDVAALLRNLELISFIVGLALVSRKLING